MSQTTNADREKLAAAVTRLQDEVFIPTYFGVLADIGHVPRTEKQAQAYLRIGQRLLLEEQARGGKEAAAQEDYVVSAADNLELWLDGGSSGRPELDARAVKRAVAEYASNPEIAAAAVLLQEACSGR